jgi:hypothetical protein
MQFAPGESVRLAATFTDAAGAAVDPATVRLELRQAGGSLTTYTYGVGGSGIVRESTGVYAKVLDPPAAGTTWYWRWIGDDTADAASQGAFQVLASLV